MGAIGSYPALYCFQPAANRLWTAIDINQLSVACPSQTSLAGEGAPAPRSLKAWAQAQKAP